MMHAAFSRNPRGLTGSRTTPYNRSRYCLRSTSRLNGLFDSATSASAPSAPSTKWWERPALRHAQLHILMFRMEWFLGGCARHARMGGILFLTLHAEFGDRMPPRMAPLCPPYLMTSPPNPPRRWEHGKEVFTEVRSPEEFDAVVLGADRPVMVDW